MAIRASELVLGLTRLGDPEVGGWCESCALPSVVSLTCAMTVNGKPWQVATFSRCVECGR